MHGGTGERVCFSAAVISALSGLVIALSYSPAQEWHELWAVIIAVIVGLAFFVLGVCFGVRRMTREHEQRMAWRERQIRLQR